MVETSPHGEGNIRDHINVEYDGDEDGQIENADVDGLVNLAAADAFSGYPLGAADLAQLDASITVIIEDTSANRPAAGTEGRIFLESDTGRVLYDDGAAWVELGLSESQISLANLASNAHADLSTAPAEAHHNQVDDETGTFSGNANTEGENTVNFGQSYVTGVGDVGFDGAVSPVNDAGATIRSYTTDANGNIDGMVIRWHNTTGAAETVRWRFAGRPV